MRLERNAQSGQQPRAATCHRPAYLANFAQSSIGLKLNEMLRSSVTFHVLRCIAKQCSIYRRVGRGGEAVQEFTPETLVPAHSDGMILAALSFSKTGLNPSSKVSIFLSQPIECASSSVATSFHVRAVAKSRKSHVA